MLHNLKDENQTVIIREGRFESENSAHVENRLEIDGSANVRDIISKALKADLIVISFSSLSDGRGFSLAKQLREQGYEKIIRAKGHLLVDQYPLALRCGFNEIEISQSQASRQPEQQWIEVLSRLNNNYLDHLIYNKGQTN